MPAPYATENDARAFYAGQNAAQAKVLVALRAAARIVSRHAPAPDPEGAEYPALAKDAELMVGEYLWETRGFKKSSTLEGLSDTFHDLPAVAALVESVMGGYAGVGKSTGGSYTLDVASSFPPVPADELPRA